jgi:hypothetical protein
MRYPLLKEGPYMTMPGAAAAEGAPIDDAAKAAAMAAYVAQHPASPPPAK